MDKLYVFARAKAILNRYSAVADELGFTELLSTMLQATDKSVVEQCVLEFDTVVKPYGLSVEVHDWFEQVLLKDVVVSQFVDDIYFVDECDDAVVAKIEPVGVLRVRHWWMVRFGDKELDKRTAVLLSAAKWYMFAKQAATQGLIGPRLHYEGIASCALCTLYLSAHCDGCPMAENFNLYCDFDLMDAVDDSVTFDGAIFSFVDVVGDLLTATFPLLKEYYNESH